MRELSTSPRIYVDDGFLSKTEVDHVLSLTADVGALHARGIETRHDETGFSCELPVQDDEVLAAIEARLAQATGLDNRVAGGFRFRRYAPGEGHPVHLDTYEIDDHTLILTALMYLNDTPDGGDTHFPLARPEPVSIEPRCGRVAMWFGHGPDGQVDPASEHLGEPVVSGEKATLTYFIYQHPKRAGIRIAGNTRPRFFCVTERFLTQTNELLQAACESRGIEYVELDPAEFDRGLSPRPEPGDLLYRVGTSLACMRLEQLLFLPGVASFMRDPRFGCFSPEVTYEHGGIRVPKTVHLIQPDRDALVRDVEYLGGFPVVLKVPGGEGGCGVMYVDSYPSLFSAVDYMGSAAMLMEYFEHVVAYRLVVVGDCVVDAEASYAGPNDFRTNAAGGGSLGQIDPPKQAIEMALRASQLSGMEFGGADVLQNEAGELVMTEFNSPCYFADQQTASGVDISGAMLDHLLRKVSKAE